MTWAYLAGFLDGDGWITSSASGIRTRRYTIGLTQKETALPFMQDIAAFLDEHGVAYQWVRRSVVSPRVSTPVMMVDIRVSQQSSVVKLATQLLPHLRLKRAMAAECLDSVTRRLDQRGVGVLHHVFQPAAWTYDEVCRLRDLHASGNGNRSIASKLGRSVDSVSHKLYRLRLVRP
jgi:hypothetical protein